MIRLIVALDRKNGIAKHGYMPWYIPEDEAYFTEKTKTFGGNVLTGGVTFREAYLGKPLADRQNFILTRDTQNIDGVEVVNNLESFLDNFKEDLWIAGGSKVFEQVMGKADELYLTHIDADFGCDQFFPEYGKDFELAQQTETREQNGFSYKYVIYRRKAT
jgi:dihydrofolate reductase